MSAIDNNEIPPVVIPSEPSRQKQKLIHFSDGSTMEVDDEVDTMRDDKLVQDEQKPIPSHLNALPSLDPKSLSWPGWLKYYSHKGASSILSGMEYSGETLAYYFGITAPKYQHEIDEYNRMVSKKVAHDAEVKAWATSDASAIPIVMEQIRSEKVQVDPTNNYRYYEPKSEDDQKV